MKKILYTDLDGTLLDLNTYSFMESLEAIQLLRAAGVPIIFCSSKTRKEQEYFRNALSIDDPFITENGSAIFIPKGYFQQPIPYNTYLTEEYEVIVLGSFVSSIRKTLRLGRSSESLDFSFYQDLNPKEVAELTGLDEASSERAMQRDFSETILAGNVNPAFHKMLSSHGFRSISGSKFQTVVDKNANKGRAVKILSSLYQKEFGTISTIAIGDSKNDEEMLAEVDQPYLVQKPTGEWVGLEKVQAKGVMGVGPAGWNIIATQHA